MQTIIDLVLRFFRGAPQMGATEVVTMSLELAQSMRDELKRVTEKVAKLEAEMDVIAAERIVYKAKIIELEARVKAHEIEAEHVKRMNAQQVEHYERTIADLRSRIAELEAKQNGG